MSKPKVVRVPLTSERKKEMTEDRIKELEKYITVLEQKVSSLSALLEAKNRVEKASSV